jgi:hypothetical protein
MEGIVLRADIVWWDLVASGQTIESMREYLAVSRCPRSPRCRGSVSRSGSLTLMPTGGERSWCGRSSNFPCAAWLSPMLQGQVSADQTARFLSSSG